MVYQKEIALPAYDEREILRYAGVKQPTPEIEALMRECIRLTDGKLRGRVCWAEYPVSADGDALNLSFAKVVSHSLMRNLDGCQSIVLFASTIGLEMDRLIARQARLSPARAHMLEAIGTERIESQCDLFCAEIENARPRFSPGYGDVPLSLQREIFAALDCPKHIGVSLNESLLMTPRKSVTAIVGMGAPCAQKTGCQACTQINCTYRRSI